MPGRKFMARSARLLATTALTTAVMLANAAAQDQPDAAKSLPQTHKPPRHAASPVVGRANGQGGLEEVTVTATRVRTRAQRTPVAVNVYGQQALLTQGVHVASQLQTIDPSVNITTSSGSDSVAVRGVSSTDRTDTSDPSVPIARDGFFVNTPYSIANSFYDVNRIEVLKGPQGTLFGRNSIGGLINIIDNRPTTDLGGYASVEAGNYNTVNSEGAVNLPLNAWSQFRISEQELHNEGYTRLVGPAYQNRVDDQNSQSVRLQLATQPIAGLNTLLVYQHDNVNQAGDAAIIEPLGVVQNFTSRPKNYYYDVTPYDRVIDDQVRWEFSYTKLPYDLSLIYSGGYDSTTFHHSLNDDGAAYPYTPRDLQQNEHPDTWNHEVRITTPQNWRVTLQAGFFAFQEFNSVSTLIQNGAPTAAGLALPVPPSSYANQSGFHFIYPSDYSQSNGFFAQSGFKIFPTLTLDTGIRYTTDSKSRDGATYFYLPALASPFAPPIAASTSGLGGISEDKPTYHIGLTWFVRPNNMLYAKYDTGYKSGGFNSLSIGASIPYGSETLKTVELGTKNEFMHRHLELNLDVFHSDFGGYQASQLSVLTGGSSGVFNVGSATIKGFEGQLVYLVDEIGRLNVNAEYLDTALGNNIIVADGAGNLANIGGHQLPNAPPWVVDAGFEHTFDLGRYGTLTPRIDGKYSGHYYFDVFNYADTRQSGYFEGNLTATYTPPRGKWKVDMFVRNFTNTTYFSDVERNYNGGADVFEFEAPLTFGARVNYRF